MSRAKRKQTSIGDTARRLSEALWTGVEDYQAFAGEIERAAGFPEAGRGPITQH